MKRIISHLSVLCLFLFCATVSRAELSYLYTFSLSDMTFSDGNRIGRFNDDSLVYRCSAAEFGTGCGQLAAELKDKDDSLTISPAIHKLSEITVNFYPNVVRDKLKVYVSTNASDWTEATYTNYFSGSVKAIFPSGDYFVKIVNTKNSEAVYVRSITYGIRDCNCQLYVAP